MPPKPSSAAVYQTLKSISATWPIDKLRPTLQLSGAISSASDRIFGVLPSSSTSTASSSKLPTEVIEKGPVKELDPKQLEKANLMIESLDRLLANSALKEFPMSSKTLEPASFPKHYKRLREGILRAENGEVVDRVDTWKNWFKL